MRNQSLSGHMRDQVQNFYDGPIPPEQRERIRIVESAEKSLDMSLPPLERAMKSLRHAFADVETDTALIEAARQLVLEATDFNSRDAWEKLQERRRLMAIESATWLQGKLAEVLALLQPAPTADTKTIQAAE